MATPVTVKNFRDAFVNSARPTTNYSSTSALRMGGTFRTFLYWANPIPAGATVLSARLMLFSTAWTGTNTVTVAPLAAAWSGSRLNWNNQPGIRATPAAATLSKTNPVWGQLWDIDITAIMQSIANGAPWYGVRVTMNGSTSRAFMSSEHSTVSKRPMILIEWSDNPDEPEDLSPDEGLSVSVAKPVLKYTFVDVSGSTEIGSHQIQLSNSADFSSPVYDSSTEAGAVGGWLDTDVAEYNLATSTYGGLADGASIWWRVRTRDEVDLESPWSEPATFKRTTKGSLTVSSLGSFVDGGGNTVYYVEDTSPTLVWSLTGRTQKAYQVLISKAETPDRYLYNSGKITSTDNSVGTGSKAILADPSVKYLLRLLVWDTIDRVTTPGDPAYYEYRQEFIYQPAAGVTAPAGLAVSWPRPWPWVDLTWTRTTPPDSFSILRDNVVVENNLDPGDLFVSGTTYQYRDKWPSPRVNHTWAVVANVNGQDSVKSNQVVFKTEPGITWLMEPNGDRPITIVKSADKPSPVVEASSMGFQEVHQPVGGSAPVLITQYISGFEGRVEGVLADEVVDGLSAKTMRDRFKYWKRYPGTELVLFMVDEAITIVPYNLTYRPRAKGGGKIFYDISFDFFQVDN